MTGISVLNSFSNSKASFLCLGCRIAMCLSFRALLVNTSPTYYKSKLTHELAWIAKIWLGESRNILFFETCPDAFRYPTHSKWGWMYMWQWDPLREFEFGYGQGCIPPKDQVCDLKVLLNSYLLFDQQVEVPIVALFRAGRGNLYSHALGVKFDEHCDVTCMHGKSKSATAKMQVSFGKIVTI